MNALTPEDIKKMALELASVREEQNKLRIKLDQVNGDIARADERRGQLESRLIQAAQEGPINVAIPNSPGVIMRVTDEGIILEKLL